MILEVSFMDDYRRTGKPAQRAFAGANFMKQGKMNSQ